MSRPPPRSTGATPTLTSTSFSTDSATTTSRPAPHDTTHELPYGSTKYSPEASGVPGGRRSRPGTAQTGVPSSLLRHPAQVSSRSTTIRSGWRLDAALLDHQVDNRASSTSCAGGAVQPAQAKP